MLEVVSLLKQVGFEAGFKNVGNAFRPGAFITVYNPLQRLDNALTTCYNVLYNP